LDSAFIGINGANRGSKAEWNKMSLVPSLVFVFLNTGVSNTQTSLRNSVVWLYLLINTANTFETKLRLDKSWQNQNIMHIISQMQEAGSRIENLSALSLPSFPLSFPSL